MSTATESAVAVLIVLGALVDLLGSIGLARLPNFLDRLHGPTKATTLGVGALLLASAIFFSNRDGGVSLHELAILLFLFLSAPVSAHLLAKAALHRQHAVNRRDHEALTASDSSLPGDIDEAS